jgi:hypothetical protein
MNSVLKNILVAISLTLLVEAWLIFVDQQVISWPDIPPLIFQFFIASVVLRWLWKYSEEKSRFEAVHRKN